MSQVGKQAPDFAIPALPQDDVEPRPVFPAGSDRDLGLNREIIPNPNPGGGLVPDLVSHTPRDGDIVALVHPVARMGNFLCEVSIIGHENKPRGIRVEATDGVQATGNPIHEIDHATSGSRLTGRTDHASGLIQRKVDLLLRPEAFTITANVLAVRIDLRAQFRDDLPIHRDSASRNQHICRTTTADPDSGQELVQTDKFDAHIFSNENFWPPMEASNMRPARVMVKTATPPL